MKSFFEKVPPTERVVFSTTIELTPSEDNHNRLKPKNQVVFKDKKFFYEEITNLLTETLDNELLPELNKQLGEVVLSVKSISVNEGSIVITFFAQVITGVVSAAIVELIKYAAKDLLTRKLKEYCGGNFFNISVNNLSTFGNGCCYKNLYCGSIRCEKCLEISNNTIHRTYKLLIYYLLITNFVLIYVLIMLTDI